MRIQLYLLLWSNKKPYNYLGRGPPISSRMFSACTFPGVFSYRCVLLVGFDSNFKSLFTDDPFSKVNEPLWFDYVFVYIKLFGLAQKFHHEMLLILTLVGCYPRLGLLKAWRARMTLTSVTKRSLQRPLLKVQKKSDDEKIHQFNSQGWSKIWTTTGAYLGNDNEKTCWPKRVATGESLSVETLTTTPDLHLNLISMNGWIKELTNETQTLFKYCSQVLVLLTYCIVTMVVTYTVFVNKFICQQNKHRYSNQC